MKLGSVSTFDRLASWARSSAHDHGESPLHRITVLAYVGALGAAIVYAIFILNPNNAGQVIPYCALVAAELLLLSNQGLMILTILAGDQRAVSEGQRLGSDARERLMDGRWQPTVDVLIPVYGESAAIIELTARAARDMRVPHQTVICDDLGSPKIRALAQEIGVGYRHRSGREGAKAGNLNSALVHSTSEFVAIFDSDHAPYPNFLEVTLPFLLNPSVGFVQTPQSYANARESVVAAASHESQRVFYELLCPGKNACNSAFSVGTNLVYRREALDEVGGLYQDTNSEDIWTSLRLHQRHWSSVYLPTVLAQGLAPTEVHSYLTQQFRWSRGAFEVLLHGRPWRLRGLTNEQRIQYLQPAMHFLQSFAMLFFMLLPALFLVFLIQPLRVDGAGWLLRYAPFWLMTHLAIYFQTGRLHGWSFIMAIAAAPVHIRAFFSALFRRGYGWSATNSDGLAPPAIDALPIQITMLFILIAAFFIGLFPLSSSPPTVISLALCLIYAFALGAGILRAHGDVSRSRHKAAEEAHLQALFEMSM